MENVSLLSAYLYNSLIIIQLQLLTSAPGALSPNLTDSLDMEI